MTVKELYCYEREEDKITVSVEKPDCDYILRFRLIADDRMLLTKDGENFTKCVDVESIGEWYEVLDEESEEISAEELLMLIENEL